MSGQQLSFAIFGNSYQAGKAACTEDILAELRARGAEVYMERSFYNFLTLQEKRAVQVSGIFDDYNFDVDYAVSIGGDGTFLKAAKKVGAKGIPIVGINMGRLGFLADVLPGEIKEAIDEIYEGRCKVEEHTVLQLMTDGETLEGCPYALNDIAVLKRDTASMISVRTSVDGEFLVTYQADGLVVSTPTGSTAYNLSNGGPIIAPHTNSICITPVAPHSLNIRPIVIGDDREIVMEVESRSHNYLVAIDGRSEKMLEGTRLIIRKAPYAIRIVQRNRHRYSATLREKLMWGADQRE
uniref:NAD kinase n=2 Tax=unclassified Prevotella TaxID=2638335 RepID=A0AB33J0P8_9BACT